MCVCACCPPALEMADPVNDDLLSVGFLNMSGCSPSFFFPECHPRFLRVIYRLEEE